MYRITIKTGQVGSAPLKLQTENRNFSRSVYFLCQENKVECEVVCEVKPRVVKFKGV